MHGQTIQRRSVRPVASLLSNPVRSACEHSGDADRYEHHGDAAAYPRPPFRGVQIQHRARPVDRDRRALPTAAYQRNAGRTDTEDLQPLHQSHPGVLHQTRTRDSEIHLKRA
jgi:hypothetical protein